jgi:nucleoside-diphosphate-sugar epimerase
MFMESYEEQLRGVSILVTGAAGFIGSHLIESLLRSDRRWSG